MNPLLAIGLFAVVAAAQLAVPAGMIVRREAVLRDGEAFKFRTAPVDPYDAFRGRYVALRLDTGNGEDEGGFGFRGVPAEPGHTYRRGQKVHARIEIGDDGFAKLAKVTRTPPTDAPWLTARVSYSYGNDEVNLELPFDRYYMDESQAPEAEQAYNRLSSREVRNTWVTVRVHRGHAVLEELYLDGLPVREYLANPPPEATEEAEGEPDPAPGAP
jgi:uncharacterized membrane-anchored protein